MRRHVVVRAAWDDEARVWYVQDSDVPGLSTEADTLEELRCKIPVIIQDLLDDRLGRPDVIEWDLIAYSHDRIDLAAWSLSTARSSRGTLPMLCCGRPD